MQFRRLMISPVGHNMHHQFGEHNACNFAAIFKIWDRALGTLNEKEPFWWKTDRDAAAARALKSSQSSDPCATPAVRCSSPCANQRRVKRAA